MRTESCGVWTTVMMCTWSCAACGGGTPSKSDPAPVSMYGSGLYLVDAATGASSPYLSEKYTPASSVWTSFPFSFGERVGAIEQVKTTTTFTTRTAMCESDTTCASPLRFDGAALPADATAYVGTVGDELVFWLPTTGTPGQALASCTRAQLVSSACVPSFVACDAPLPASSGRKDGIATDGTWLYYVAAGAKVVRVRL